ncbi:MAG: NAD(P)-binding domain-containing protein [Planctomycetes bacterium]|nr:NAD(P)-binding domain-containing protein [Planctomycetota bacterium]
MTPTLFALAVLVVALAAAAWRARRAELGAMRRAIADRERAERSGAGAATLQYPAIDLSRCLGCATCVAVCPEDGVLAMVHGQAAVVNGSRCMGIAACERECPAGAIEVTLGDLENRADVPVLTDALEAAGRPGLFLAGEVTAHALIRTAIDHGTRVARAVAQRVRLDRTPAPVARRALAVGAAVAAPSAVHATAVVPFDLVIVGAGPAGLACALEATRLGLRFVVLEQEPGLGGAVARYPRGKLVLTQPVELPLHGRLRRTTWSKEELIALWTGLAERHALPIECGESLIAVDPAPGGGFVVRTAAGRAFPASHVCLALGRRGTPRRLGVPGEELPNVTYALLDARDHAGRRALVVGGGDSAVETALALAGQAGATVTLSYRSEHFHRIRARNEQGLREAVAAGRLCVLAPSRVVAIAPDHVELDVGGALRRLPNDEVVVQAGGVAPLKLLQEAGVSFDPALRPPPRAKTDPAEPATPGRELRRALTAALMIAAAALAFVAWHADYYALPMAARPEHPAHRDLRPGRGTGLGLGIAAATLVLLNLLYLLRRARVRGFRFGSLRAWMTSHVATGTLAFVTALLHGALAPRDTPGGHAFWGLCVLMVTGAIGRWFYAFVPRAANGRELELAEVRRRIRARADGGGFAGRVRQEVTDLVERSQWPGSFGGRIAGLLGTRRALARAVRRLESDGRAQGVSAAELREARQLARDASRAALQVAHFEDLRAILASWRWLHRWVAAWMLVLLAVHLTHALVFADYFATPGVAR